VKLVPESGIADDRSRRGEGHADLICISGDGGGTGQLPCPRSSTPGIPWEPRLAKYNRRCCSMTCADGCGCNRLQLKTGRDVVIARSRRRGFGFATAPLIVEGCV